MLVSFFDSFPVFFLLPIMTIFSKVSELLTIKQSNCTTYYIVHRPDMDCEILVVTEDSMNLIWTEPSRSGFVHYSLNIQIFQGVESMNIRPSKQNWYSIIHFEPRP
nr:hypothetical protein Iba_chr14cCG15400 [Ipomoea batatas]